MSVSVSGTFSMIPNTKHLMTMTPNMDVREEATDIDTYMLRFKGYMLVSKWSLKSIFYKQSTHKRI